mmetsp:Transcript_1913/g.4345  ORF Transcript_1913/g.4345 Transcript_1913/m.4345 type:complete len:248 (-) Transcript_1913:982-1725(-)
MVFPGGGDEDLFQKRKHGAIVFRERLLRVVGGRGQRGECRLLHHPVTPLQHLQQLSHECVEIRRHVLGRARLREVDHRCCCVRLNAMRRVLHRLKQHGEDARVVLLLELWPEIRAELPDTIHCSPPHARVRVRRRRLQAWGHRARHVLHHALNAPLRDLRQRHQCGMALLPVRIGQQRWDGSSSARQHRVGAECDGDAVKALLADVVALALALASILLLLCGVPLRFIFNVQQKADEAVEEPGDKVW